MNGKRASHRQTAWPDVAADLVVSHHLAGLTYPRTCEFIAPRIRLWASTRFNIAGPRAPKGRSAPNDDSRAAVHTPRRMFLASSRTVSPRPLPSWRYLATRHPLPKQRMARLGSEELCRLAPHSTEVKHGSRIDRTEVQPREFGRPKATECLGPVRRWVMLRSARGGPPRHQATQPKPSRPTAEAVLTGPPAETDFPLRKLPLPKQRLLPESRRPRPSAVLAEMPKPRALRRESLHSEPASPSVRKPTRTAKLTFKALLHLRVWYAPGMLPPAETPYPSWASFPFKVLVCAAVSELSEDPTIAGQARNEDRPKPPRLHHPSSSSQLLAGGKPPPGAPRATEVSATYRRPKPTMRRSKSLSGARSCRFVSAAALPPEEDSLASGVAD